MTERMGRRAWLGGSAAAYVGLGLGLERAAAQSGGPTLQLALNESPFGPSPRVQSALRGELARLERYTSEADTHTLTKRIAELEGVSEAQVILGEILEPLGLSLAMQGGAGSEFIYSDPGYTALVDAARPVGGVGVPVPLDAQLGNDLGRIASACTPRTRAVFLVNPHNPSGTVCDAAELTRFIAETSKRALVIVDEAYLEYTDDFAERTAAQRVRAGDDVIVFRTFSKIHGLAALPLGYAIAPLARAATLKKQGLGSPRAQNRLAVIAATASLQDSAHIANVRARVRVERERWHKLLTEWKLRHTDSRASFVFFESRRPQVELATALSGQGIAIGRAFPPLHNWTRISIGLPAENQRVQAALHALLH